MYSTTSFLRDNIDTYIICVPSETVFQYILKNDGRV